MHFQNLFTIIDIRQINRDAAIKTTRTKECWIEHIGPVGSCHHDYARIRLKTIHFNQNLVEGLLALIMATT
jgi:hypothetical protein